MDELKNIIAKNLITFRKNAKLTQLELAEKLNYSDKAISKWECAETIPDIYILTQLASIYNISVNDIITENSENKSKPMNKKIHNKVLISLLSCGLVWLGATICFVVLQLLNYKFAWLVFVYAVPVTFIVLTVFSSIWFRRRITAIFSSIILWSISVSAYLTLNQSSFWVLFLISIPLQALIVLWFIYKKNKKAL